jgi:hypothetical protein
MLLIDPDFVNVCEVVYEIIGSHRVMGIFSSIL